MREVEAVHQTPEANDHPPHRYTLCEACRELWLAARFGAICPLCEGPTIAVISRSRSAALPGQIGQPAQEGRVNFV